MLKLKTTAVVLISMFLPFLLSAAEGPIRRSPQAVKGEYNDDALATAAATDPVDFLHALLRPQAPMVLSTEGTTNAEPDADNPRAATEWRLKTMADEHGKIPPGAVHRANLHRKNATHGPHFGTIGTNSIGSNPINRVVSLSSSVTSGSWTSRGPQNVGGRTLALLVHPTNNQILYAASASGGLWQSTNGGATWTQLPLTFNLFIGALAFDPLNPNIIYAGTGERFYDRAVQGAGIFKSTDGGATWTQLAATANWLYVSSISALPGVTGTLLAATDSGIYRTTNGGGTWTPISIPALSRALMVAYDPNSDPNDPNRAHALAGVYLQNGFVQAYSSSDGGATFTAATGASLHPGNNFGDIAVSWSPSMPGVTYALVGGASQFTPYGELWRSADYGVNYTRYATGTGVGCVDRRCELWVAPNDDSLVVTGGVDVFRSTDSGSTFSRIGSGYIITNDPHPDVHCIAGDSAYSASNRTVYVCTDGGVFRTSDITTAALNSGSWTSLVSTYQTTQFYGGIGHNVGSAAYFGGAQDNGDLATTNTSSNARLVWGGDGGFVDIDPTSVNTWYFEEPYLLLYRSLDGGFSLAGISAGLGDSNNTFNANFIAPIVLDPNHPTTLLAGGGNLWRTTSANQPPLGWSNIRPNGGGCVTANPSNCISAIAVAPGNSDLIYVGQNDGVIQKTTNGTATTPSWSDVDNNNSKNPLPNRYITRIYVDPGNNNTVYVTLGGYSYDNLWKSIDGGNTFASVSGSGATSLPPAPIRGIVRHPRSALRLYAGTDVGLYESEDGGATWSASQGGPGDVMIDEVRFVIGTETLLAATHGRGLWTADVSCVATITSQPTASPSTITTTGGSSTLSIGVSGSSPTILWYTSSNVFVGSGASISVSPATTTSYYATVSSSCTSPINSSPVTVTVCVPASIPTGPTATPSTITTSGGSSTLSVGVAGTSPITVLWYTISNTFVGSGTSVTVTPPVTTSYYATASNSCGSQATSGPVTVTVCLLPVITAQPTATPSTIDAGGSSTLSIGVSGATTVQWYTGTTLVGTGTSIVVTPPGTSGKTIYYAVVSNSCGSVPSNNVGVTICTPGLGTTFTATPSTISSGQSSKLEVGGATGTGPLTYLFYKSDGTFVGSSTNKKLFVSPTVTTNYYYKVSNSCGVTDPSPTITVTVQ